MFAIQNIKTKKFVYGTDYSYTPPRQRTSGNQMLTYESLSIAKQGFLHRKCGRDYEVVLIEIMVTRLKELNGELKNEN